MNLTKLEQMAIEMMSQNTRGTNSINNKTILFELLTKNKCSRLEAPIKAATLWFEKTKVEPTSDDYMKKITSIKNSLDTMVSNYNNQMKIDNDKLLNGSKLVTKDGLITIVK